MDDGDILYLNGSVSDSGSYARYLLFLTAVTPHKVMLITKTERLEFYANLGDITSANKSLFVPPFLLVNLDNIARIDKTQLMIYFENGDSCPVSRLKMKALLKKWSEVKDY